MSYLSQKPIGNDYRSVKIYRCLSYPNKEQTICYVINGWPNDGQSRTNRSKLTECERPSETIYLADNEDGSWRTIIKNASERDTTRCDVFESAHLPKSDSEGITGGRRVARARHRNGCNILYLAGHADFMEYTVMTEEMWKFKK